MARPVDSVSRFLQSEIDRGSFPGAQYVIGVAGEVAGEDSLGYAVVEPERIPVTTTTVFDLASLTKPLVTSMLAVKFAERGIFDLGSRASEYIKDLAGREDKQRITITQLLTHTSGFQRWQPFYRDLANPGEISASIAASMLEPAGGNGWRPVVYSDLNYILMGLMLARVGGDGLDRVAQREIFAPLRLGRTMFNPPERLKREIAATSFEATGQGNKEELVWGRAHDPNARFLGGVAGHAGLFSTSREVFKLANQFLPGSKLVTNLSLALFTENLTPGGDTARSLGWLLASSADCSAGPALPPTAMGHNGFTGTSVWIDPLKKRVLVLLTNRLHPRPGDVDMKAVRQRFNTLAVEELDRAK